MAPQLHNVIASRHCSCVAHLMHLVRCVKDNRTSFRNIGFPINIGLERTFKQNHEFIVDVLVRCVGLDARSELGLMHLYGKTGMLGSEEDTSPLFRLTV